MTYWGSFLPAETDYSKLGSEVKLLPGIISFIIFRKPQPRIEVAYSSPTPVKGFNDIFSSVSAAECVSYRTGQGQLASARKEDNLDEELEGCNTDGNS